MAKSAGECFLCEEEGKVRRVTFYSGVRKAGSRTELLCATVTVFERWRDLRIYEIHVCRECQQRLWAEHTKMPPILCAIGAALLLLLSVVCAVLLPGELGLVVAVPFGLLALGVGGVAVWLFMRQRAKPEREQIEPLIVKEAMWKFPDEGHTFITSDQYVELIRQGILG